MAPAPLLLLCFLSPVWAALSLPLTLAAAAAADGQVGGESCSPVRCGNVSISFPFRIVPDQAMDCGLVGFQVLCSNNTPYLGYARIYWFQILDIFYGNGSLIIADVHKLRDFNASDPSCHAPTNNSSTNLGYPFSISPLNQNLIFHNCRKAPATAERGKQLLDTVCRNNTFVRVAESYDQSGGYGRYFLEGCDATVVPVLGGSGKMNASKYRELISDGFLLTWEPSPLSPPMPSKFTLRANKSV